MKRGDVVRFRTAWGEWWVAEVGDVREDGQVEVWRPIGSACPTPILKTEAELELVTPAENRLPQE
jgi:hypothetical protein